MKKALLFVCLLGIVACSPAGTEVEVPAATELEAGSFFADLNGFRIHYEIHGSGPVLMTVPNSWGINIAGLRAIYRPLESDFTMVYFDPRGMGESALARKDEDMGLAAVRADFDALRMHLKLERVDTIGWSNGAVNLLFLAIEKPEILDSVVFLHGAASFTEEDGKQFQEENPELMASYMTFLESAQDESVPDEEKTLGLRKLWLEGYFPLSCADPEAAKVFIAEAFADCPFSWPHVAYTNKEAPTFDARDQLGKVTSRSLVIQGTHDMMPVSQGESLRDGIADATLVLFEASGHFAPLEEREKFVKTVVEFLSNGS